MFTLDLFVSPLGDGFCKSPTQGAIDGKDTANENTGGHGPPN
jgi:hypothetical protein